MKPVKKTLQERLNEGTVFCGEGYLFELERRGYVQVGPYVPSVVLENPDAVEQLHREILRSGSDIIEAFTYYAHREKLKVVGLEDKLEEMNKKAISIAKKVADEGGALVAGNICNTNIWKEDDMEAQEEARQMFREQCKWANECGVDLIIGETFDYLGEAKVALEEIQRVHLDSVITFSIHQKGTLRDGYTPAQACKTISEMGATVVGCNCVRGPSTMIPILEDIKKEVPNSAIAALPVPYNCSHEKPTYLSLSNPEHLYMDLEPHLCTRFQMAEFARKCREIGVTYIGVCCGGAPYHLRAMVEALGKTCEASKYSPDISKHFAYGNHPLNKKHNMEYATEL